MYSSPIEKYDSNREQYFFGKVENKNTCDRISNGIFKGKMPWESKEEI